MGCCLLEMVLIVLLSNYPRLKESTKASDKVTRSHKRVADSLIGVATYLGLLSIGKDDPLSALYKKTSDSFEKIRVSVTIGAGEKR